MEMIEQIELNGYVITVFPEDCAEDPRQDYDHVGHMACFHSRYILGDKDAYAIAQDFVFDNSECLCCEDEDFDGTCPVCDSLTEGETAALLEELGAHVLPLYLYDHGGISMSTGDFADPWDSGIVGFIFMLPREAEKECIQDPIAYLKGEVKEYDSYLRGERYYYTVEKLCQCESCQHTEMDLVDSCGGFYSLEEAIEAAKDTIGG